MFNRETLNKVLVTGHEGYIGAVMVPVLRNAGYQVVGLDTGYFEGCNFGTYSIDVPTLRKDIRDLTASDLTGFDAVIHLAALSNDPLGDLRPEWTDEINYRASVRLATLAREAGVKRFLYASSCSLYGAAEDEVVTEKTPLRPLTPYALSKARAEETISRLANRHFSPVFLRNATAYGLSPRLRIDLVLNNLVGWAFTTGRVHLFSDGKAWRPLVHVSDIARAFLAVLSAPRKAIHNQVFNVGVPGENYQIRELALIVCETIPSCEVEFSGEAASDPRNYRVDFSKIVHTLPEFKPKWNVRWGAAELFDAFLRAAFTYDDFQGSRYCRLAHLNQLLASGRLDETLRWRERAAAVA